ncbi:MAG: DNA mismatch repair protein MutS [Thermodesulfovibrionaceae bacterium]
MIQNQEFTPLMRQYFSIKEQYKDVIVFFRLGDFYEMFGEDALVASEILGITLTSRDKTKENPTPMCGIPYFTADSYIEKLLRQGYKVAICEQIGDSKSSKGIIERQVVKVLTPGTYVPEGFKENVYLMSIYPSKGKYGFALADISVGEFVLYETDKNIVDEISRFEPKEVILPASYKDNLKFQEIPYYKSFVEDWKFDYLTSYRILLQHFKVTSLKGFGVEEYELALTAAGVLISYLEQTRQYIEFKKLKILNLSDFMLLDSTTKRNLEIFSSLEGQKEGSLLWVLDETLTPMGFRFLKNALSAPLVKKEDIQKRLDYVDIFFKNYTTREKLRVLLKEFPDLERIASKINSNTVNPRELKALKEALKKIPEVINTLAIIDSPQINEILKNLFSLENIVKIIEEALVENPPIFITEGGIFRNEYSSELAQLRDLLASGKKYITQIEAQERAKTGINSLKIGYNRVFGYYIEVTKPNLHLVPSHYQRKQTLSNTERFITDELKELEAKILGAEERIKNLEQELFYSLIEKIKPIVEKILKNAETLGYIDFICSLATVAAKYKYVKPEILDEEIIEIKEGRHPVIERLIQIGKLPEQRFIPNDLSIGSEDQKIIILTGPNMAGKSTYMRQNALVVLMAQIGSFVPAKEAKIGIVDRIFTRIGASDYLAKGQSTFMVEMIEVANILNNATSKSLIILDEVGRGTSTFDGISIAWAVVEYIAEKIKARTLFATHYHELTELAFSLDCVKNYTVVVKEWGDEIIFLRKIEKGGADRSYGIQVARLAGLPKEVLERARNILSKLEKRELQTIKPKARQLDLFFGNPIIAELSKIDLESLTPQKALKKIIQLKEMLKND